MNSEIYKQAKYYEIAFSFVDAKKQVDLFEEFIKQYSKIKVKSVLDIGCGTALQLREFAKRNYKSIGLDISQNMLDYLKNVVAKENITVETIKADMTNFHFKEPVDFAYIMMGSIIYLKNNTEFLNHLSSVADSLKSGGLYLIENLAINWASPDFWTPQTWDMEENGIRVETTYQITPKDPLKQIVNQEIKLKVNDSGKDYVFVDNDSVKIILPQEFKTIVELQNKFEFIGFFERENIKRLTKVSADNIVLLRKK